MKEEIPPALDGERLDRVVAMLAGITRAEASGLVGTGHVRLDGATAQSRTKKVRAGQSLEADVPERPPEVALAADDAVRFEVVFADDDVIVVDKPPHLVVHPGAGNDGGTLVAGILARYPEVREVGEASRPGMVHRLDSGTSGLLVVARSVRAYASLVAQLQARTAEREYLALVLGAVEHDAGVVDAPIGRSGGDRTRMAVAASGREARTRYAVARRYVDPLAATLLECRLETGRTHQIRVHLAAIGHPVVGDLRYGGARPAVTLDRPFLHARRLSFEHPRSGERVSFESGLPGDLERVLDGLS